MEGCCGDLDGPSTPIFSSAVSWGFCQPRNGGLSNRFWKSFSGRKLFSDSPGFPKRELKISDMLKGCLGKGGGDCDGVRCK